MDVFAALADPIRRGLIRQLASGPARVVDLASGYEISRPAISKHLRLLVGAGLATAEDRGRERHYTLHREALQPVRELLAFLTPPLTETALDALELEVRRAGRDRRATSPLLTDDTQETA